MLNTKMALLFIYLLSATYLEAPIAITKNAIGRVVASEINSSCLENISTILNNESDIFFIQLKAIHDIIVSQDVQLVRENFLRFAKNSNVKFEEVDGVFKILPIKDGSTLNKFVATVTQLKSNGFNHKVEFVFSPKDAHKFQGCYKLEEAKVFVSLNSIFVGKPTNVEIHELIHLEHDFQFKNKKRVFLRSSITPFKSEFIGDEKFNYAKGLNIDEFNTHSSDLRSFKKDLRLSSSMSDTARKNLFFAARRTIQSIYENNKLYEETLSVVLNKFKSNRYNIDFKLLKFENGNQYVSANYRLNNALNIEWNDREAIEMAREYKFAVTENERELIYQDLARKYVSHIFKLKKMNDQLIMISKKMLEKSSDESFLTSEELSRLNEEFVGGIQKAEEDWAR